MAAASGSGRVLVVGAGAIGLRTAVELLRRNLRVTLRAPVHPLDAASNSNCSVGAGGLWMPYHCDDARTDRWSLQTLEELLPLGKDPSNDTVEMVPAVVLKRSNDHVRECQNDTGTNVINTSHLPPWTRDDRLQFQQLTVEMLSWQNLVNQLKIPPLEELTRAGYKHAWMFQTPVVDSPRMLQTLLDEIIHHDQTTDVNVETGEYYQSVSQLTEVAQTLDCDSVVNCTGMGSQSLCDDSDLVGGRGALLHFDRATCTRRAALLGSDQKHDAILITEEPPWASQEEPCYMIPRGDIIAIGGTYSEGDMHPTLRESERKRLKHNATCMGIDLSQSTIRGEWTGFRPYRHKVRCESEDATRTRTQQEAGVRVIHNYGHGGSGWTVNVGAAKEVANLLLDEPP